MSYVSQQFLLYDGSSVANFKNWGQAVSNALSSMGWVQTADTGQVNWSTIAVVPTAGTSWVYEIWGMGDALQTGSTKIFMKVQYAKSTNNGPSLQFQLAPSTDGAGNLTGITSALYNPQGNDSGGHAGGGSILTSDCYFSGDTNRFGCMMWRSVTLAGGMASFSFVVERTHNTDGTDSGDGVHMVCITNNNHARGFQTLVFGLGMASGGNPAPDNPNYSVLGWDSANASAAFNNQVPIFPACGVYGKVSNPLFGLGWVHNQDVAEGTFFTTTLYGATRTYIASIAFNSISGPTNLSNARGCLRYD